VAVTGPRLISTIELDISKAEKNLRIYTAAQGRAADKIASSNKKIAASGRRLNASIRANIKAEESHVRHLKAERIELERSEKAAISKAIAQKRLERATYQTALAERRLATATRATTGTMRGATHSFGTFSKALGTSITLWYTARTAVFAFKRMLESVLAIYTKGIKEVDEFRLSVIGASAIMIPSIEQGTTAAEKMAIAWAHNKKMLLELELVAAKHITTGKSIQEVYTGMVIAQVYPKKEDVENLAQIADYITVYTKGQQLGKQLLQEVRGLMDGQVRVTNKLAYMLNQIIPGGLKKNLALWKAQGRNAEGELIVLKMINKYLGDIAVLQGEILGSASTWRNTLETIAVRLLRDAVKPAYEDITRLLRDSTRYLIDQNLQYTVQAEQLKWIVEQGWERIKDLVRGFVGSELSDANTIVDEMLGNLMRWVEGAGPDAVALGESLRAAAEGVYWALVNIKKILTFIFVMRAPVWFLKILEVIAGVAAAGAAGTAGGLVALAGILVALAKATVEAGANFETAETALDMFDKTVNNTSANVQKLKDALDEMTLFMPDIAKWWLEKAPVVDPKFKVNVKESEEEIKRLDKAHKAWYRRNEARVKAYWAMRAKGVRDYSKHATKAWKDREKQEQQWYKENEKRDEDRLKLRIEGERDNQRAIQAGLKETARLEKEVYELGLGGKKGLELKRQQLEDSLEKEKELLAGHSAETLKDYEIHVRKKELLESNLAETTREQALMSAQATVSAGAEALRIMAQHNKKYFRWYQAAAIAEIAINTAVAMMTISKQLGIFAPPAMAAVAALGVVQAAAVMAQKPPEELAEGGVSSTGFSGLQGVYGQPTYMIAEKQGRPEAVVPLDKYVVSDKETEGGVSTINHYYIMAQDAQTFRDFARRNPSVFREQFTKAIEENDPRVKSAVKTAAR
jgi:hypothetical protein